MVKKFRPQNHAIPPCFLAPIHGITDLAWATAVLSNYPAWEKSFLAFLRIPSTPFSPKYLAKTLNPPWFMRPKNQSTILDKIALQLLAAPHSRIDDFIPLLKEVPFSWLDLNLGCSTGMVQKHGGGAALLKDWATAQKIIHALRQAWPHTFSIKIRPGINDLAILPQILKIAQDEGVDVIIVHGRLVKDKFTTPANPNYIKAAAQLTSLPLIANGDLQTLADGQNIMTATHVQGVMYGRAGVGRPWLIAEALNKQKTNPAPHNEAQENNILHPYLHYAHLLSEAWLQANLPDHQILARFNAIAHWWPALPNDFRMRLYHQTKLHKFMQQLTEKIENENVAENAPAN